MALFDIRLGDVTSQIFVGEEDMRSLVQLSLHYNCPLNSVIELVLHEGVGSLCNVLGLSSVAYVVAGDGVE